jgi:gluconolactonase
MIRSLALLVLFTITPCDAQNSDALPLGADARTQPGVPQGERIKTSHTSPATSIYPGTEREVTLYLPTGLDRSKPASFMVFQDGVIYQATTALDNLIHQKAIPPLIGIFVKPGILPAANAESLPRFNRSLEYDSVTSHYAEFLLTELLPALEKAHGFLLSKDPDHGAIAGSSSGGIAAWMAAWHRPDRFRRVFTSVGTYVDLRGGNDCASLVRKMEPKPLRIFLQDGSNDLNGYGGNWWLANQEMLSALQWAGYEVNHAWGDGGHNQKHASVVFPDAMRWLWSDWQADRDLQANPQGTSKWRGYEVLMPDSTWQKSAETSDVGLKLHEDGTVTATELLNQRTRTADGTPIQPPPGTVITGTTLSPDQSLLYATAPNSIYVVSSQLHGEGALRHAQRFIRLHEHDGEDPKAAGMCVDEEGRIYIATALGIQVSDQAGRVHFIIPTPEPATDVCFGGADLKSLFVVSGKQILQRATRIKGVNSARPPIKPQPPKL